MIIVTVLSGYCHLTRRLTLAWEWATRFDPLTPPPLTSPLHQLPARPKQHDLGQCRPEGGENVPARLVAAWLSSPHLPMKKADTA